MRGLTNDEAAVLRAALPDAGTSYVRTDDERRMIDLLAARGLMRQWWYTDRGSVCKSSETSVLGAAMLRVHAALLARHP